MKYPSEKPFRYETAEKSRKPGYLKARMAKYREQVRKEAERPSADIHELTPARALLRKGTV